MTRGLKIRHGPLNKILSGEKTMEIRNWNTKIRGRIYLLRTLDRKNGSGGTVDASCDILEVIKIKKKDLQQYQEEHALDAEGWDIIKNYGEEVYGIRIGNVTLERAPWKYPLTSAVKWVKM